MHIRIAVRFLLVSFVVVHVQGHFAHLAVEASFVPVLKKKKKNTCGVHKAFVAYNLKRQKGQSQAITSDKCRKEKDAITLSRQLTFSVA